jgi:hypothetical protein
VLAATLWSFEAVAQALAIQFANPIMGMMQFMNWWFASFLFGGIMIHKDDIVWPLKIFCWITPHTYALRTLVNLEFGGDGQTYAGAVACVPGSAGCKAHAGDAEGWRCPSPSIPPMLCYGETGDQVLDSLGANFQTIERSSTFWEDLAIVLGLGLVFKLLFVATMIRQCRESAPMQPVRGKGEGPQTGGGKSLAEEV